MEAVTTTTSTLIMSSPTVVTPTRSHAAGHHPHHGYAGTDDDQGTDPPLDAERLTLMSGHRVGRGTIAGLAAPSRVTRTADLDRRRDPYRQTAIRFRGYGGLIVRRRL
jgi:hypothetical protein